MPPHRLDRWITSAQVRETEENEVEHAREIRLVVPLEVAKAKRLVIRSIVQANDAMIHQHKLIWPLQLCHHTAVLYSENDRVHGASTARPSINSRWLFPGPHRERPFFGY